MITNNFQITEKVAGFGPFKSKIKALMANRKALYLLRRNRYRAMKNSLVAGFGGVVAFAQVTLTVLIMDNRITTDTKFGGLVAWW